MLTTTFDRTAAIQAIDEVAGRLTTLVTTAPDTSIRVPASPDWTVAETFAHVVTVAPRYAQGARHEGEWVSEADDLAGLNARQIAALPTADVGALADLMRGSIDELERTITGFGDRQPVFTFHGGERISADVALGILLGELMVHGHDIALALGRPWPIDPAHVELIMQGITPILPGWLDARGAHGHTGRYEVRLRGQGTHRFDFDRGRLRMNPAGAFRPDVTISADPATMLLVLYRRVGLVPGILTGRLVAYGRRPWLALTLTSRFHRP